MSMEIELKGKSQIAVLILIGLILGGIFANRASLHFDQIAKNALNRDAIISQIGPWFSKRMQKYESGDEWVQRKKAEINKGSITNYQYTIGLIDVRGFGDRVVAGIQITDNAGKRTRYFILDWNYIKKEWTCGFYSEGDVVAIHPEVDGYGFIGQFFQRAQLEGSTEYQDVLE